MTAVPLGTPIPVKTSSQPEDRVLLEGPHSRVREFRLILKVIFDFVRGFRVLHFVGPCVTVFGSARVQPGHPYYGLGIEMGKGLARLGHTDSKGMPHPLQLALSAREFSDVVEFRSPPLAVQRAIFAALAPIARRRGYRATYPQLSRIVLAPRT